MNDYKEKLVSKAQGALLFIGKYRATIMVVVFGVVLGFTILRINEYSAIKRDEDVFLEKLTSQKVITIDPERIQLISESVSDQTTTVEPIFTPGRINPFAE